MNPLYRESHPHAVTEARPQAPARRPAPTLAHCAAMALCCLVAAGALTTPAAARAQGTEPAERTPARARFDVPAGPLAPALRSLAGSANVLLSFTVQQTEGRRTAGVSGQYTFVEALSRVLAGTGLQAEALENGGYVLRAVPVVPMGASAVTALAPVIVRASAVTQAATGPVEGYVATRTATATKTDTPLLETPQSVSIVTADQMQVLNAQSLSEVLSYTAGVASTEAGRANERFVLRGFEATGQKGSLYRDGTKFTSNVYQGQQEPYGMERVELLRGAASVLYGNSAPGGIINAISKRPSEDAVREVGVDVGNFDRKQMKADVGGRLSKDGRWLYRLTGLVRDSNTFIDHMPDDRRYFAPALTWQPLSDTRITVLGQYQKTIAGYVYGLPASGTVSPTTSGRIPRNRFLGEPGHDTFENTTRALGYLLEQGLGDRLKLRQQVRLERVITRNQYADDWGFIPNSRRVVQRSFDQMLTSNRALTADTSIQATWGSRLMVNTTLLGVDVVRQREVFDRYGYTLGDLDLFEPRYGVTVPTEPKPSIYADNRHLRRTGLYLQNQAKILERWVVSLGGRYDWTRNEISAFSGDGSWSGETNNAFTGRAGAVYLADGGWAPFASFSQSFEPAAGRGASGERFKPTTGEQIEAGLRFQPHEDFLATATVYRLAQQNVLTLDPMNRGFRVQTGEIVAKGAELELKGKPTPHLEVIAAYAYTQSKTTKSTIAAELGRTQPNVPRHQASVWAEHGLGPWGMPGVKLGAGVRFVGATRSLSFLDVRVPNYTLIDAMASYTTGPWRFALNVSNLTDRDYVANCTYGCFYGEARKIVANALYRW